MSTALELILINSWSTQRCPWIFKKMNFDEEKISILEKNKIRFFVYSCRYTFVQDYRLKRTKLLKRSMTTELRQTKPLNMSPRRSARKYNDSIFSYTLFSWFQWNCSITKI